MSFRVVCVHCGHQYVLNERYAGSTVRCRTCGKEFRVPHLAEQELLPSAPLPERAESTSGLQSPGGTAVPSSSGAGGKESAASTGTAGGAEVARPKAAGESRAPSKPSGGAGSIPTGGSRSSGVGAVGGGQRAASPPPGRRPNLAGRGVHSSPTPVSGSERPAGEPRQPSGQPPMHASALGGTTHVNLGMQEGRSGATGPKATGLGGHGAPSPVAGLSVQGQPLGYGQPSLYGQPSMHGTKHPRAGISGTWQDSPQQRVQGASAAVPDELLLIGCGACGREYSLPVKLVGAQFQCHGCGAVIDTSGLASQLTAAMAPAHAAPPSVTFGAAGADTLAAMLGTDASLPPAEPGGRLALRKSAQRRRPKQSSSSLVITIVVSLTAMISVFMILLSVSLAISKLQELRGLQPRQVYPGASSATRAHGSIVLSSASVPSFQGRSQPIPGVLQSEPCHDQARPQRVGWCHATTSLMAASEIAAI